MNIMMQGTTGAKTAIPSAEPCLTFSHTCIIRNTDRYVAGFLQLSAFHIAVTINTKTYITELHFTSESEVINEPKNLLMKSFFP